MAGLLTWYINRATGEEILEAELIENIYELLRNNGFTEREIAFGMYIAGNYALAVKTVAGNPHHILSWYREIENAHPDKQENIERYIKAFTKAIKERADTERDVV